MRSIFYAVAIVLLGFPLLLKAEIREIDQIAEILTEVREDSLVLLDIDETLIEMPIMLGGKAWRSYAIDVLAATRPEDEAIKIHDKLTYFIVMHVPYRAIERSANDCFDVFRKRGAAVFGLTARGKNYWYDMPSADGEELTILHLKQAGFNFEISSGLIDETVFSHPSFGRGIFFVYPLEDKGELILELFTKEKIRPSNVIFVDDKIENVHSVSHAFEQLQIPAIGFHYRHIDLYRHFDPMIANIQLEKLLLENTILSDESAARLKENYSDRNPEEFLIELAAIIDHRNNHE
jgi:hypothetical protein